MKKNETSTFRDKGCFFSLPSFFPQALGKKSMGCFPSDQSTTGLPIIKFQVLVLALGRVYYIRIYIYTP